RMYHRQVSSSPRPVEAIICSSDGAPAAEVAKLRLSMPGVTGTPAVAAECREEIRAASEPSRIQEVRPSGSPLSKTDESGPDACATTNGVLCRPAARGSLDSVTGWEDSCSPMRVPPPGLLNTVRPSAASFAPADQYMYTSRSDTAVGGSRVSYRPAGSATVRSAQPNRSVRPASRPAMSTSVKSRVDTPVQADRAMSADLAFSSTRPVGWSCRSRSPAEVPRKVLCSWCSANP